MNSLIGSSILSAFATAGAVTAIFWKLEDTASPQLKARVTEWLRFRGDAPRQTHWAGNCLPRLMGILG